MNFIDNLTIRGKLLLMVGVLLAVGVAIGAIQWQVSKANERLVAAQVERHGAFMLADELRQQVIGDAVTWVSNRNINTVRCINRATQPSPASRRRQSPRSKAG